MYIYRLHSPFCQCQYSETCSTNLHLFRDHLDMSQQWSILIKRPPLFKDQAQMWSLNAGFTVCWNQHTKITDYKWHSYWQPLTQHPVLAIQWPHHQQNKKEKTIFKISLECVTVSKSQRGLHPELVEYQWLYVRLQAAVDAHTHTPRSLHSELHEYRMWGCKTAGADCL